MIKVNGVEIEMTSFPNRETCVGIDPDILEDEGNIVFFQYRDDGDLIKLMFVKKWIDDYPSLINILVLAHIPYARLDRKDTNHSVFTLKHVSEYINWLGFEEILVIESHSDVAVALLNNTTNMPLTKILFNEAVSTGEIEFDPAEDFVCYPDATAQKRYGKMGDYKALIGMKDRDFQTGWIKNLDIFVPGGYSVKDRNVVIVDDLCSKGGTFILTAKELRKLGAKSITLIVAHCEETILDGEILKTDLIDNVITSNSMISQEQTISFEKMHVADLEEML